MMNDLIKKGFYLGLGTALASKEKAEKYMKEFIKSSELAPGEAKKFIDELTEKGRDKQEEWGEQIRQGAASSLKQLGFVTKNDLQELVERLERLENKLDEMKEDRPEKNNERG